MVAARPGSSSIPDRTPRATSGIDHHLGTGAELPTTARRRETFQRMNAVAGAVAHFRRAIMMDVDHAAQAMRDEEMLGGIEDFLEGFNQPTYRGIRVNGQRVATWSSRDGWSRDSRPDAEWLH
jgi:hypothetical protein